MNTKSTNNKQEKIIKTTDASTNKRRSTHHKKTPTKNWGNNPKKNSKPQYNAKPVIIHKLLDPDLYQNSPLKITQAINIGIELSQITKFCNKSERAVINWLRRTNDLC